MNAAPPVPAQGVPSVARTPHVVAEGGLWEGSLHLLNLRG